ncbi:hypothetical protein IAR55_006417 [Kwoniella newhampshirensis]|uniref:Uncharacterized protein n=1 Tax=Kwoniella newhampshirensis TaxID=1651941 RepID=A0AAW0YF59_9TREE
MPLVKTRSRMNLSCTPLGQTSFLPFDTRSVSTSTSAGTSTSTSSSRASTHPGRAISHSPQSTRLDDDLDFGPPAISGARSFSPFSASTPATSLRKTSFGSLPSLQGVFQDIFERPRSESRKSSRNSRADDTMELPIMKPPPSLHPGEEKLRDENNLGMKAREWEVFGLGVPTSVAMERKPIIRSGLPIGSALNKKKEQKARRRDMVVHVPSLPPPPPAVHRQSPLFHFPSISSLSTDQGSENYPTSRQGSTHLKTSTEGVHGPWIEPDGKDDQAGAELRAVEVLEQLSGSSPDNMSGPGYPDSLRVRQGGRLEVDIQTHRTKADVEHTSHHRHESRQEPVLQRAEGQADWRAKSLNQFSTVRASSSQIHGDSIFARATPPPLSQPARPHISHTTLNLRTDINNDPERKPKDSQPVSNNSMSSPPIHQTPLPPIPASAFPDHGPKPQRTKSAFRPRFPSRIIKPKRPYTTVGTLNDEVSRDCEISHSTGKALRLQPREEHALNRNGSYRKARGMGMSARSFLALDQAGFPENYKEGANRNASLGARSTREPSAQSSQTLPLNRPLSSSPPYIIPPSERSKIGTHTSHRRHRSQSSLSSDSGMADEYPTSQNDKDEKVNVMTVNPMKRSARLEVDLDQLVGIQADPALYASLSAPLARADRPGPGRLELELGSGLSGYGDVKWEDMGAAEEVVIKTLGPLPPPRPKRSPLTNHKSEPSCTQSSSPIQSILPTFPVKHANRPDVVVATIEKKDDGLHVEDLIISASELSQTTRSASAIHTDEHASPSTLTMNGRIGSTSTPLSPKSGNQHGIRSVNKRKTSLLSTTESISTDNSVESAMERKALTSAWLATKPMRRNPLVGGGSERMC